MVVHDQAVWFLMAVCSLAAVVYALHARPRAASAEPLRIRAGRCLSAVLDGLGIGLGITFAFLAVAAVLARI